jgi:5-formyltetrahydrofolate cyclo-ligase
VISEPSKPALRAELRAARDSFVLALPPGQRERLEARAAEHLSPLIDGARCVAFYAALGSELACAPAIALALSHEIIVALPHVEAPDRPMRFLAWKQGDRLESGWRGLIQPAADSPVVEPDIIVAPLLGFDSAGRRIGQGAGFYDRTFAARPAVRKIGLGWSIQQRPAIVSDPWDEPLDAIVTEAGVIEEKGRHD